MHKRIMIATLVLAALLISALPVLAADTTAALDYLKAQQNADGGFPYISPSPYGTDSDSNSTAVVIWAIKAAGQDPAGDDWKRDVQAAIKQLMPAVQCARGYIAKQEVCGPASKRIAKAAASLDTVGDVLKRWR